MYCPEGFMDLDSNDGFCYRLESSVSVKNGAAEKHCKMKHGGQLTSIRSKVIKDAHVKQLAKSKLKNVYLQLTLQGG